MTHIIERLNAFPPSRFDNVPPRHIAVKVRQPEFYRIYKLAGESPEELEYRERLPVHTFMSKRAAEKRIQELSQ